MVKSKRPLYSRFRRQPVQDEFDDSCNCSGSIVDKRPCRSLLCGQGRTEFPSSANDGRAHTSNSGFPGYLVVHQSEEPAEIVPTYYALAGSDLNAVIFRKIFNVSAWFHERYCQPTAVQKTESPR